MPARQHVTPTPVADLSARQQQNFESDFVRVSATNREMRKAGRKYIAYGWRMAYDALASRHRRRKAPWECRIAQCACTCHREEAAHD